MAAETVPATTNYGPVYGRKRKGVKNNEFLSFQGIPYAGPPIGELRFKDPQLPLKWSAPLDATKPSPCSWAMEFLKPSVDPNSSEDCLYLNIFTKNLNPEKQFPVMVWIHGGGFIMGSSGEDMYGPEFLMEKDIVLVTINYRLGALGFLSIDEKEFDIPGNAGLKDQAMALKWVRENCSHFGGDEKNITIFGQSAGAASVHYHLVSDYSKGLFDRAILQSGSVVNSWANRPKNDFNIRLATKLGWNGEGGTKAMLDVFKSATPTEIVEAQAVATAEERQNGLIFGFVPQVEPYDNGSCFIPRCLSEMLKTAWGNKIPILTGANADDGYISYREYQKIDNDGYFENAIPRELNIPNDCAERVKLGAKIKKFYYGNDSPNAENIHNYMALQGDILFWNGVFAGVQARINDRESAATYFYRFSFNSELLTFFKTVMVGKEMKGTLHGEDIVYLFKALTINDNLPENSLEVKIRDLFVTVWTEFSRTGNPNCDLIKTTKWEAVNSSYGVPFKCFNIDADCEFIDLPETGRMAFWDSINAK